MSRLFHPWPLAGILSTVIDRLNELPFDVELPCHPVVGSIADRLLSGGRATRDDGIALFRTNDLPSVAWLAHRLRLQRHGKRAWYIRNQHINYTNQCISGCRFCSFHVPPGAESAYLLTPDDIRERLLYFLDQPLREIHMVGGLHPAMSLSYACDLLDTIHSVRPEIHIKAFTAVEIAHIAHREACTVGEVLQTLRDHGLGSVPGGGAEVLSERVHQQLYPGKLGPKEWLQVSRQIAEAGLPQYATMLYGHIETIEERVDHLLQLRALQDGTGHLLGFTPLAFHPARTRLSHLPPVSGHDDLLTIAVSRILLDNIGHIKTFWVMHTPDIAQLALSFGADDMDGTIMRYEIVQRNGSTEQALDTAAMRRLITEAGYDPVERDSLYNTIETNTGVSE